MELELLLEEERTQFINAESFVRQLATHIRRLAPIPSDEEIAQHLTSCRDYYQKYGTIDGEDTPWVIGKGRKWESE